MCACACTCVFVLVWVACVRAFAFVSVAVCVCALGESGEEEVQGGMASEDLLADELCINDHKAIIKFQPFLFRY